MFLLIELFICSGPGVGENLSQNVDYNFQFGANTEDVGTLNFKYNLKILDVQLSQLHSTSKRFCFFFIIKLDGFILDSVGKH